MVGGVTTASTTIETPVTLASIRFALLGLLVALAIVDCTEAAVAVGVWMLTPTTTLADNMVNSMVDGLTLAWVAIAVFISVRTFGVNEEMSPSSNRENATTLIAGGEGGGGEGEGGGGDGGGEGDGGGGEGEGGGGAGEGGGGEGEGGGGEGDPPLEGGGGDGEGGGGNGGGEGEGGGGEGEGGGGNGGGEGEGGGGEGEGGGGDGGGGGDSKKSGGGGGGGGDELGKLYQQKEAMYQLKLKRKDPFLISHGKPKFKGPNRGSVI